MKRFWTKLDHLAEVELIEQVRSFFVFLSQLQDDPKTNQLLGEILDARPSLPKAHLAYLFWTATQFLLTEDHRGSSPLSVTSAADLGRFVASRDVDLYKCCISRNVQANVIARYRALVTLAQYWQGTHRRFPRIMDIGCSLGLGLFEFSDALSRKHCDDFTWSAIGVDLISPEAPDLAWFRASMTSAGSESPYRSLNQETYEELRESNARRVRLYTADVLNPDSLDPIPDIGIIDVLWTSNLLYQLSDDRTVAYDLMQSVARKVLTSDGIWIIGEYMDSSGRFCESDNKYVFSALRPNDTQPSDPIRIATAADDRCEKIQLHSHQLRSLINGNRSTERAAMPATGVSA